MRLRSAVVVAILALLLTACGPSTGYSTTVIGFGSYVPLPGPDGMPLPGRPELMYTVTNNGSSPRTPTCDISVSYKGQVLGQGSVTGSGQLSPGATSTGHEPLGFSVPQGAVGSVSCH